MFTTKYISSHLKFKHPFTAMVCGPSGSGKSELTRRIISEFENTTDIKKKSIKVLWCYSLVESIKTINSAQVEVSYHQGLPDISTIRVEHPDIIVLDDLMTEVSNNEKVAELFTRTSHHLNVS